ncbi:MAG: acyl-CoA dehydrogenase family protein [Acidimicrobiales bacterium]
MDFTFSAEQDDLRQAVRSTLATELPHERLRALMETDEGFTDELWAMIAGLGWTGVLVPQSFGGLGLGLVDMVVLQEEMGRLPLPGPFFSSAVFATLAAVRLGADELLADLASGAKRGTVALEELGHGDPVRRVAATATATASGKTWLLDGLKPVVLDGHTADWAIVVARSDDGLGSFLVDAPRTELVPALDVSRKVSRLDLSGRSARRIGPPGDQTEVWQRVVDDAAVALCAELVGVCSAAVDLAVEYAKSRVQFDRPIATFQVIKHKTVDMLHRLELSRVGTHYAAWTSDIDDSQREAAAAMCKGYVGEAANFVTAEDIQIHGGMGFTWDVDAHIYYRRAKQDDLLLGYSGHHRHRLADLILGPA